MIDWEKRRAEYKAGKFRRKIVKREPEDLTVNKLTLECGHTMPTLYDISDDGYKNCRECAEAEE